MGSVSESNLCLDPSMTVRVKSQGDRITGWDHRIIAH